MKLDPVPRSTPGRRFVIPNPIDRSAREEGRERKSGEDGKRKEAWEGHEKGVPLDNEHIVTHRTNNYYRGPLSARAGLASALIPATKYESEIREHGGTRRRGVAPRRAAPRRVWLGVDTLIIARQIELSRCCARGRAGSKRAGYTGFRSFPPLYASSAK